MSNVDPKNPADCLPDLLIRAGRDSATAGDASRPLQIFAPWLDRLPVAQRDLLSILPVLDINGALFSALGGDSSGNRLPQTTAGAQIAALLCVDPFLRLRDVSRLLKSAKITAVTNFPTIQVVDGTAARGFESADLGVEREAEVLHQFSQQGFSVVGFATSTENAIRLMERGLRDLVIHPGPPSTDWRNRASAGQKAAATLTALRARSPASLRLFCPAEYGHELDPAHACADGLVRYA